jgi:Mlc titration factor MtfA (ptsG expression regulator)
MDCSMFLLKQVRRKRIRSQTFPSAWLLILEKNVPLYRRLPDADKHELQEHIEVFLAEKHFEGAGGLKMNDEIKVTIAAQACMLLLHRKTDYYPGLLSIIVYPHEYIARHTQWDEIGLVSEGPQVRLGESSRRGAVVLAWDHVRAGATDIHDCHNVVFHEFAHELDAEDGSVDGAPALPRRSMYLAWARVLGREYERLRRDAARGSRTLLDRYGATNPAEFFAVATECFFTNSIRMKEILPELYEELRLYYQQDPAGLIAPNGRGH